MSRIETAKGKLNGYANQANVLLTSMTGLIIATASKLIPSQDQLLLITIFALLWAEAYLFRLEEKKLNAEIERQAKPTAPAPSSG